MRPQWTGIRDRIPRAGWAAALAMAGCSSLTVTPDAVRAAGVPAADRARALATWTDAVALANAFLASPFRRTLPPGRVVLDDATGMRLETAAGAWPLEVRCTTWGRIVNWSGGRAQEAAYGFAVGQRGPPDRDLDAAVDNSMFRGVDREWVPAGSVARLLLHEATHVVYEVGTVGFWPSVVYYLELFFLFRSSTNSAEDRPRATSEEFTWWHLATHDDPRLRPYLESQFREHLAIGADHCRHGPFRDEPLPVPPLPPAGP